MYVPMFLFSQSKREQKKYSEIVDLIEQNELELAREQTNKLLEKNKEWKKPHLLLSQISIEEQDFEEVGFFLFVILCKLACNCFLISPTYIFCTHLIKIRLRSL